MENNWVTVYDLTKDQELIAKVQKATLETTDFGLVPEVALYGTAEWWEAISSGVIPKHTIEGIVTDVFVSGDSHWPQFEIESGGTKTTWTRSGKEDLHEVGRRVRLEYVVQKPKRSWTGSPYQNEVLSIRIEC